jgi:hypothetical protein
MMIEAVSNFETSLNFNVTTRCYIPEDSETGVGVLFASGTPA